MVIAASVVNVDELSGMSSSSSSSSGLGSSASFHLPKDFRTSGVGASGMNHNNNDSMALEEIVSDLYPLGSPDRKPSTATAAVLEASLSALDHTNPRSRVSTGVRSSSASTAVYSNGYHQHNHHQHNHNGRHHRRSGNPSVEQYPEDELVVHNFDRTKNASRLERFQLAHHRSGLGESQIATRNLTGLDMSRHRAHEQTKAKVVRAAQVLGCITCLLIVTAITLAIAIPLRNNSQSKAGMDDTSSAAAANGNNLLIYDSNGTLLSSNGTTTAEQQQDASTPTTNEKDNQLWFSGYNATNVRLQSTVRSNYTQVALVTRSATGAILQLGEPITGAHSVTLSRDGNRFAVLATQGPQQRDFLEVWEWQTPPPPTTSPTSSSSSNSNTTNTNTSSTSFPWSWQQMGFGISVGGSSSSSSTTTTTTTSPSTTTALARNGFLIAGHERVFYWNQSKTTNTEECTTTTTTTTTATTSRSAAQCNEGNNWQLQGGTVVDTTNANQPWASVALNADGTRLVAVGAHDHVVRVYQFSSARRWEPLGDPLRLQDGQGLPLLPSECDVSMSATGDRIAIGTRQRDTAGYVHVFELTTSGNSEWMPMGSNFWAATVALSASGNRVVLGGPQAAVTVYDWMGGNSNTTATNDDDDKWVQVGSTLYGRKEDDVFGYSVATTDDGTKFVVGSLEQSSSESATGYVRVYTWSDGLADWEQVGGDVNGVPGIDDGFGSRVDIAKFNGNRIAVSTHKQTSAGGATTTTTANTKVFAVIAKPTLVMGNR